MKHERTIRKQIAALKSPGYFDANGIRENAAKNAAIAALEWVVNKDKPDALSAVMDAAIEDFNSTVLCCATCYVVRDINVKKCAECGSDKTI